MEIAAWFTGCATWFFSPYMFLHLFVGCICQYYCPNSYPSQLFWIIHAVDVRCMHTRNSLWWFLPWQTTSMPDWDTFSLYHSTKIANQITPIRLDFCWVLSASSFEVLLVHLYCSNLLIVSAHSAVSTLDALKATLGLVQHAMGDYFGMEDAWTFIQG